MSENKTNTPARNVLNQPISFTKKINYPTKTRMNLYEDTESGNAIAKTVLVLLLLFALVAAFTKFGVIDRLQGLNELRGKANSLEATAQQETEALANFKQIKEDYYRKTGKHLSEDEKVLSNRMNILSVLESGVGVGGKITSSQINGNTAQITVEADDLDKIAQINEVLRNNQLVSAVNMNRADKTEGKDDQPGFVTATITVKFKSADEVEGGN